MTVPAARGAAGRQAARLPEVPAAVAAELRLQGELWREYAVLHLGPVPDDVPAEVGIEAYVRSLVQATTAADHGVAAIAMTCLRRLGSLGSVPSPAARDLPAPLTLAGVQPSGRDAARLTLAVPPGLRDRFRPLAGQHVAVHADMAGMTVRRTYSVCSPPASVDTGTIVMGVRAHPGGLLSPRLVSAQPGTVLTVSPPSGMMTAVPDPAGRQHVVLFAAGSGITPLVAVAATLLAGEPRTTVALVVVERRPGDLMLAADIADLRRRHAGRFAHRVVPTRTPHGARPDVAGLADSATELGEAIRSQDPFTRSFACGPAAFTTLARDAAHHLGVAPESVAHESFDPAGTTPSRPRRGGRVVISAGDATRDLDVRPGETLLSAALRAGAELPFSCLAGSCGTCRVRVLAGDVGPTSPDVLGTRATAQGWVLACQAAP